MNKKNKSDMVSSSTPRRMKLPASKILCDIVFVFKSNVNFETFLSQFMRLWTMTVVNAKYHQFRSEQISTFHFRIIHLQSMIVVYLPWFYSGFKYIIYILGCTLWYRACRHYHHHFLKSFVRVDSCAHDKYISSTQF